ncbi:N-acetyltransferase [Sphaerisporangium krabiense]|uniref:Ribosomal protein S18 acetylase RimI-like enzyme n=1 Tax=Sphaerisporangium krabiense TaxID=763782 RepID=A0A7W9DR76_9ACTN|nr:GNAT family N-acetyltransferase [Sphaerisporangium krabiense]MBB5627130.1 ribosomal protein S18 acetylase RimI-like enzyme [Sphaerisporangium krabiense]GII65288.1 N-acetyltransferase [Sphaerisporangium krabiense]
MTADDVLAVSTVRVSGWRAAYAGLVPAGYLDRMSVEADAERRRDSFGGDARVQNLVAELGGEVVGWGVMGPCRDEGCEDDHGEIYALYVAPPVIGAGVGRALMRELVARADAASYPWLSLWVLRDNHRARRFYERAGFHWDGGQLSWHVDGEVVPEVRYRRSLEGSRRFDP